MKGKKELEGTTDADDAAPPKTFPIAENLFSPEVYADAAAFFALKSGNIISITFSSLRYDNSSFPDSSTPKNVIIGRLVMPVAGAMDLIDSLNDYLMKQGLKPGKAGAN
ncbi:MAG TPA: hypothetical protein VK580_10750 [Steroidobacteraceae bacterium]|nr:hypothetical protein [Steroidobacteraceae bacterium]